MALLDGLLKSLTERTFSHGEPSSRVARTLYTTVTPRVKYGNKNGYIVYKSHES
jgi:hypothetical protein